jgi:hypothetical protein
MYQNINNFFTKCKFLRLHWGPITTTLLSLITLVLFPRKVLSILSIRIPFYSLLINLFFFLIICFYFFKTFIFKRIDRTKDFNNEAEIKEIKDFDEKENLSTNISFLVLFIGFTIFLLVTKKNLPEENKYIGANAKKNKNNEVGLLITKYKPIKNQSIFSSNYYELDFSSSLFKKLLLLNKNENYKLNSSNEHFQIDYYNNYYEVQNIDEFKSIYKTQRYKVIIMGEIIEEDNKYFVMNDLFLIDDKIQKNIELFKKNINNKNGYNSDLKTIFFSDPLTYYNYILNNTKTSFKNSINYEFNFDFKIEVSFPNILSFISTFEQTPFIIYYYVSFLLNWTNYDFVFTNKLNELIIDLNKGKDSYYYGANMYLLNNYIKINKARIQFLLSQIDELILRITENLRDSKTSYSNRSLLIQLYLFKAYFYNEFLKMYQVVDFNSLDDFGKSYYFNKIDNLFLALKTFYQSKEIDDVELKMIETYFYYCNSIYISSDQKNPKNYLKPSKLKQLREIYLEIKDEEIKKIFELDKISQSLEIDK